MNALEWRATLSLGAIYALRMVGMFMILPVFQLYARSLPGEVSPALAGMAFWMYGLVQALLQIPFGIASDRWGRKPVIVAGMLLFALGSVIAGSTHAIHWIMAGRAVQGAGAVSAAVSALVADTTRVQVRTTAMAILGAGMGLAFILAMVLGPVFYGWIGVNGIFYLTAVLALLSIPLVVFAVPNAPRSDRGGSGIGQVLADGQLMRLNGGVFMLHAMMMGLFQAAPYAIVQTLGLPVPLHWHIYLPVLLVSIVPIFPLIRWAESHGQVRPVLLGAIACLGIALVLAAVGYSQVVGLWAAMLLFFAAFNYLEGSLPSMISRRAPLSQKGAALGVFSTAQVLGGAGAPLGGLLYEHLGLAGAFVGTALLAPAWLAFAWRLEPPPTTAAAAHASATP
jgi:MFS family permease